MSGFFPESAMILAAGRGERLRPLTDDRPKPLMTLGEGTLLDHALDKLCQAGVPRIVVNAHYKAQMLIQHLEERPGNKAQILISHEAERPLDTGGGVKNALPLLRGESFFVLSGDMPLTEGSSPSLARLAKAFDPEKMDALLLVLPTRSPRAHGFDPQGGDFFMQADGRLTRKDTALPRPYVYISAMIVQRACYEPFAPGVFSNNLIFDEAEAKGRLYGLEHDGACFHISTPQDYAFACLHWAES